MKYDYATNSNSDIKKVAGNNYFTLNNGNVNLVGILKEMPTFGLSTDWETAPIGELGSKLTDFFCSDKMQMVGFIFGETGDGGFKNQISIDDWTSRMYKNTSSTDITLNFRIYSKNTLGQSTAGEWKSGLMKYATIDSSNSINADAMLDNISKVLTAAKEKGGQALLTLLTGGNKDPDRAKRVQTMRMVNSYLNSSFDIWIEDYKKQLIDSLPKDEKGNVPTYKDSRTGGDFKNGLSAKEFYEKLKITVNSCPGNDETDEDKILNPDEYKFKFEFIFFDSSWCFNNTERPSGVIDTETGNFKIDETLNSIETNDSSWTKKDGIANNVFCPSLTLKYYKDALTYVNDKLKKLHYNPQVDLVKDAGDTLTKLGSKLTNFQTDARVYNATSLGARLWKLKLFPFIYKKPLIVYISSWSCAPSKEMIDMQHAYYDFSISCALDQNNTAQRWKAIFEGTAG